MKKICCIVLCVLLLAGCGADKEIREPKMETKGVYYEKIDKKEVGVKYNEMASYSYSLLAYANSVYTSSYEWTWWKNETEEMQKYIKKYLGNKLCTVYGNHQQFWSVQKEDILESTDVGNIYRVKGYDERYRICVFYQDNTSDEGTIYGMQIFDCLNDIQLEYGKELYQTRLCLDNLNNVSDESEGRAWTEKKFQDFKKKLYQGKFMEEEKVDLDNIQEEGKTILFSDGLGDEIEFLVWKDEIVALQRGGYWFLVRMK